MPSSNSNSSTGSNSNHNNNNLDYKRKALVNDELYDGGSGFYQNSLTIPPTLDHTQHYALTLKHEMNLVKSLLSSTSLHIGHSLTDDTSNVVRLISQQHSHPKATFDTVNLPLPNDFLRSTNTAAAGIIGESCGHIEH